MKIIPISILGIFLLSSIGISSAQYMGNTENHEQIETAMRCAPPISQARAFIAADLVLTGTIDSILQTIEGSTQYQVDVNQYLKGTQNEESLVFMAQGTEGQIKRYKDIAFNSGDMVYLYLTKTGDGTWTAISRSHVISKFCGNIQDPNSPILENMPRRDLVTSDFKRNHGGGYLEGSHIVYNFYALNP